MGQDEELQQLGTVLPHKIPLTLTYFAQTFVVNKKLFRFYLILQESQFQSIFCYLSTGIFLDANVKRKLTNIKIKKRADKDIILVVRVISSSVNRAKLYSPLNLCKYCPYVTKLIYVARHFTTNQDSNGGVFEAQMTPPRRFRLASKFKRKRQFHLYRFTEIKLKETELLN